MIENRPLAYRNVKGSATPTEITLSNSESQAKPNNDLEHEQATVSNPEPVLEQGNVLHLCASTIVAFDIEHVAVKDDPRLWPRTRKLITLAVIAFTAVAPTLAINMYNPAFKQIEKDLQATPSEIALSLSLFIVVQGNAPLFWSAVSEIKGRKGAYIVSMIVFAIGSIVAALAHKISILIAMRVLQAAGSSSALTLGGGTLADVFDTDERGTIMGIYYAAPLLGPALGPIIGGLITATFSWRATFWFLVMFACAAILSYLLFFKETFRKERSYAYQAALTRANLKKANQAFEKDAGEPQTTDDIASDNIPSLPNAEAGREIIAARTVKKRTPLDGEQFEPPKIERDEVKLTLADMNILGAAWYIIRQRTNAVTLIATSLTFGFQYGVCYTAAITFAEAPYNYGPTAVGLILLSFGVGCVAGSVSGGRWSDRTLRRLEMQARKQNAEGKIQASTPEMRLRSTLPVMPLLPSSVLAYAWMAHIKVNIAGPVVMLFIAGFSCTWIYSSTLTYIVDANTGRSSTAIATNSSSRGIVGLIIAEISVPLQFLFRSYFVFIAPTFVSQDVLGDGGLYSIWAGVLVFLELTTVLVMYRGAQWRAQSGDKAAAPNVEKDAAAAAAAN